MTESILLVGVLVPIVVGPLSIFCKSLWDRYNIHKDNIKRNRYESKMKILESKINLFYWPVYIKLKCLYRLNYKYHKKDTINSQKIDNNNIELEINNNVKLPKISVDDVENQINLAVKKSVFSENSDIENNIISKYLDEEDLEFEKPKKKKEKTKKTKRIKMG